MKRRPDLEHDFVSLPSLEPMELGSQFHEESCGGADSVHGIGLSRLGPERCEI